MPAKPSVDALVANLFRHEAGRIVLDEKTVELDECVEEALRLLGPKAAEHNVRIEWSPETIVLPPLCCDPLRLRQILLNVLGRGFTRR